MWLGLVWTTIHNGPDFLGLALSLSGLYVFLNRTISVRGVWVASGLMVCAGLCIHNLMVAPLAMTLWIMQVSA